MTHLEFPKRLWNTAFPAFIFLLVVVPCTAIRTEEPRKQLIGTKPESWRSASVFTHVIWRDLLFFGGSAGQDGGDPRHEMEIGVFRLKTPEEGSFHPKNPIVTREQFGLDRPGRGITPLSIFEHEEKLFLFCTSRPGKDLQPRIVVIEASVDDPLNWKNLTTVIGPGFSGQTNNHGVSVLIDPDDASQLLLYFAARTAPAEYRILLATVPVDEILEPDSYRLVRDFENPVLAREHAKANYPFIRFVEETREYELWYSGHSRPKTNTRSIFASRSKRKDQFILATQPILDPTENPTRNDAAYATGPKVHGEYLYYSGRREADGNYTGIFCVPLEKLRR